MGFFDFLRRRETRAEAAEAEDPLLKALLGGENVTRETALQIPAISGGIDLIAGIIAGTPIKLYREQDGKTGEVRDDPRLRLLNDEVGDTLSANEFWRAMVRDYYLGKGGFAYIRKEKGMASGLFYVDERQISIRKNTDPIFKDFDILVEGRAYFPHQFLRILRNTRDGCTGVPITEENARLIEVAYSTLLFERNMVRRGGVKRGFLKSERPLEGDKLSRLREAFSRLYGGENSENFVVLNSGMDFKESSSSPMEMQLRENKAANAADFAKIFHLPEGALTGESTDTASMAKLCAIPLMNVIQCALNRDLLLEQEKGIYYFAFDTKELLKGDMQSRFAAYKTALDANFMGIDEVRFAEDLEPLGLNWIKLGLQDVLYDPKTRQLYTPNTDRLALVGGKRLPEEPEGDILEESTGEERGSYIQGPDGKMRGSRPSGRGKTKYAPSKQRNRSGIQLSKKKYAKLCGVVGTRYPGLKEGEIRRIRDAGKLYTIRADGYGGFVVLSTEKIE